jgi:hypothetical protein
MLPRNGRPFGPGGKDRLDFVWRLNRLIAQRAAQQNKTAGVKNGMKAIA